MTDDRENPQWAPEQIELMKKEWGDRPPIQPRKAMPDVTDDHPNAIDMLNKSQREAAYWRERCEALIAAMRDAIASGYPWPRENVEQCEHDKFNWEDCIACYDDFLEARLSQFENITPETDTPKGKE